MQNELIGPISREDWLTMRLLRGTIKWMRFKDPIKFQEGIKQETDFYQDIKRKYA